MLSTLTVTPDETSADDIKPSPESSEDVIDGCPKKIEEQNEDLVLSPPVVPQSSREENTVGRDNDCETQKTWKGDPWSQEDVRILPMRVRLMFFNIVVPNPSRKHYVISFLLQFQDKKLKSVVSARKKALRKRKQGRTSNSTELEINWQGIGSTMERDGGKCKERYFYLRQSQGGKGPVPWTREEDKQILALVAQHGMLTKFAIFFRAFRILILFL